MTLKFERTRTEPGGTPELRVITLAIYVAWALIKIFAVLVLLTGREGGGEHLFEDNKRHKLERN